MIINFSYAPNWFRNFLEKEFLDELHEAATANGMPGKNRPRFLSWTSEYLNSRGFKTYVDNNCLFFDIDDKWATFATFKYHEL